MLSRGLSARVKPKDFPGLFVGLFMCAKMFTTISTSVIMLYVSEISSTDLRGKAMSYTSTCWRLGAILVPYIGQPLGTSTFFKSISIFIGFAGGYL
jgi:hypothetical protein